ncbi:MAG TPA: hypothetical protein VFS88_04870 [Micavibrio sp.]|nr:hypothetical protein [Micavibrio sp.]
MKKIVFSVLTAVSAAFTIPAYAADIMVASTMQRCTTNEECALVTNSCQDNCGYVPVNRANLPALETLYQSRCNKAMSANPTCNMNPPISAACINARCTIDYAYANNAGAKDYQSGAYPVPEAPVPSKVPAGAYSNVNDRDGHFTAYDLPQNKVRQDTVGQIVDKVYVPPSAPVSGGNYVPVTGTAPSATPPAAPVAAPATPAYAPGTNAAPPAQQPPPAIPPVAVPTNKSYATPPSAVPAMTPSKPNQLPPGTSPAPTPAPVAAPLPTAPVTQPEAYVPAPTQPTIPAPGLPPAPGVKSSTAPAVPAVGAPGVPQAPAGSVPIPPSDLKPAPTFVPPPGTPVPVGPEDPGAPPPKGTTMLMPLPNGETAVIGGTAKVETKKTFTAAKPKSESYN